MSRAIFIKELHVQGFRGVRHSLSLQLGRKLTILFGGNASGKSSIVQAIQYGLTGEVVDQWDEPINRQHLQHLRSATAGQIRIDLITSQGEGAGNLTASTAEQKASIKQRAVASIIRDWNGSGDPPFTVTHVTSQELLSRLLSPSGRLHKTSVATLFSSSYLRLMTRRAEIVANHCRRLAQGDNAKAALKGLRERLEGAKALRDALATVAPPRGEQQEMVRRLNAVALRCGVDASHPDVIKRTAAVLEAEVAKVRDRLNELRGAESLFADLTACDTELKAARSEEDRVRRDHAEHHRVLVDVLDQLGRCASTASDLRQEVVQAQAVVRSADAYDQWAAHREVLAGAVREAETAVSNLDDVLSTAVAERHRSADRLKGESERVRDLEEGQRRIVSRLDALRAAVSLPLGGAEADVRDLTEVLRTVSGRLTDLEKDEARARVSVREAEQRHQQELASLDSVDAAMTRAIAAGDDLMRTASSGECPLCGHDHQSHEALIEAVASLRALRLSSRQVSADAVQRATGDRDAAREQLQAISGELGALRLEVQQTRDRLSAAVEGRTRLQSERTRLLNVAGVPEGASEGELGRLIAELQTAQEKQSEEAAASVRVRDQAASEDEAQAARVISLQSQADQSRLRMNQGRRTLQEHVALAPPSVPADTLDEQRKRIATLEARLLELGGEEARTQTAKAEAERRMEAVSSSLAVVVERVRLLEMRRAVALKQLEERGVPTPSAEAIATEEATARERLADALSRLEEFRSVEEYFASVAAADRVRKADESLTAAANELQQQQNMMAGYEAFRQRFESLRLDLVSRENSVAEAVLTTTEEPCRRLFHAMTAGCPWPLQFRLEDDRIVARLGVSADAPPAASILNAAYFNVAAVALRLSLAAHQTWSHLRTAVLDDPILEMDNLTQASLIDGLESILGAQTGPWRDLQLVLTTWSDEFALMASHKLAHLNEAEPETFVVYQLEQSPGGSPSASRFAPHWSKKTTSAA